MDEIQSVSVTTEISVFSIRLVRIWARRKLLINLWFLKISDEAR